MLPLTPVARTRTVIRIATVTLFALSLLYLGWGFHQLLLGDGPAAAVDLEARWIDNRYVLKGQNPWDVLYTSRGKARETSRDASIDPDIGRMHIPGGNPPWSYLMGALVVPPFPQLVLTRIYFALLSSLALALLALYAHRSLRDRGGHFALLGAATVLGMTANLFTLSAGQYGILINGFMVASLLLAQRGRWIGAGTMLGFTLLKPHIGGAFVLLHLARGNVRALAVALALVIASTIVVSLWIKTGPLEYMRELLGVQSLSDPRWGYGLHSWIARSGVDLSLWLPALGLGGALLELALLWRYRAASLWTQLAIAAVIGRLWTYHGVYDNVMLVFLPLALLRVWSEGRHRYAVPLAWFAVMATLAAPIRYGPHITEIPLQMAHVTTWIIGLWILLRAERSAQPHLTVSEQAPPLLGRMAPDKER